MQLKLFTSLLFAVFALQAASAQEPADGARLADGCSGCHGLGGTGGGAIPPITGLAPDDFIAQMLAFREQTAPATIMNRLARGYTDDEIAALAKFFSTVEAK